MAMPNNSFTFNGINSLDPWGIKVIVYDMFSAAKRDRKVLIPGRDGRFDYGRKYYDEKLIRLDCTASNTKIPNKAAMREVIAWLSKRGQLILWDEQDKYYAGELIESVDVDVWQRYIMQGFVLPFLCFPFAFGNQETIALAKGINSVTYAGTAETPTQIIIRNPNNFPISNITISAITRTV
jgi:predicted phage tail component-like protein